MTPERWQKVEQIYHAALERQGDQRATFLNEACGGDESLRREVESLLAQEGATGSFLKVPALEVAARGMANEQAGSEADGGGMVGKTISRYQVLAKLGAGGMGEVYRAHDERLQRDVALKVLPAHILADETARKRFRKEALALSKLNHPNIATVYDFDTQDGVDFLVMEYVAGATLTKRITDGALPEKEVAQLGIQIAAALEEAQEQGVVHRDLKPGNVMVTPKGQVKVLDFGLAKLVRPVADTAATMSMTETPAAAGTLPYMPPEQLQGKVVDARADMYALGAVLYEMGTGQRAFPERESHRLITAILHETPQTPRALNREVSAGLESIIFKALEKDPERRYQSARELRVDLERLSGPEPFLVAPRRRESIAVLPLANLSGDPEQDYFADGMTEALIMELGKIGALRVISRRSVMRYRGSDKPLPEIARELDVETVVEGSALRSGDRVRITAQLIHAATDSQLWAERYERNLRDILVLQGEVTTAIAREINVKLTPQEQSRLASARTVNPEAHEAYLKGRFHWYRMTPEDSETATKYFQLALEKDPGYALAHLGIAYLWSGRAAVNAEPPREVRAKWKAAVLKAIELDDTLGEAHAQLAGVRFYAEWDWAGAETEYRRAIELNPNLAEAHLWYGLFLNSMRRWGEANAQTERALELDPHEAFYQFIFGAQLLHQRRYDEAIAQLRKSLRQGQQGAHRSLWTAFHVKQMYEEALVEAKAFLPVDAAGVPEAVEALERGYAEGGYPGAMRRAAEKLAERSNLIYVNASVIAELYACAGEKEQALRWLEKAYENRNFDMLYLSDNPAWDSLCDDPCFQDLLRRMNFPDEAALAAN